MTYSASTGAVAATTLPLALDLATYGMRAVSIAPGSFDGPTAAGLPDDTPWPERFGAPDDYAQLAEHFVGNTMLDRTVIRLDGGLRMRPSEDWKS